MISDMEWEEFYLYCKSLFPMWAPDKSTVKLFIEFREAKLKKEGKNGNQPEEVG